MIREPLEDLIEGECVLSCTFPKGGWVGEEGMGGRCGLKAEAKPLPLMSVSPCVVHIIWHMVGT